MAQATASKPADNGTASTVKRTVAEIIGEQAKAERAPRFKQTGPEVRIREGVYIARGIRANSSEKGAPREWIYTRNGEAEQGYSVEDISHALGEGVFPTKLACELLALRVPDALAAQLLAYASTLGSKQVQED